MDSPSSTLMTLTTLTNTTTTTPTHPATLPSAARTITSILTLTLTPTSTPSCTPQDPCSPPQHIPLRIRITCKFPSLHNTPFSIPSTTNHHSPALSTPISAFKEPYKLTALLAMYTVISMGIITAFVAVGFVWLYGKAVYVRVARVFAREEEEQRGWRLRREREAGAVVLYGIAVPVSQDGREVER
ncbi:hypothetical protein EJ05DRAFT_502623 [Pseudovirgaria hyperparasitica]|uniref:Uncharacterized protein n=1 Tax=Pseudovirgaria hyperparasitica TaxID=470096 RepID=A0A6A6W287_9PEZI|nr:uncharacterized protein EJ05DRAFT_502623 [Pseudovirgaria hyperparasitica]KAF2756156.1 hypothetical protein EJ05DRAFT_502623 [Pseudovirgaria hyperparasitica]